VAGFGNSHDNRLVITQEWNAEAMAMWFVAAVAVLAAAAGGSHPLLTAWVDRASAGMLVCLPGLTAMTGARTAAVYFKICPVVQTAAAVCWLSPV
jgi:hypothetical protein